MKKNKILLVEDELNLRDTITDILIYHNYDVKSAENGQKALEILDHWTPDLIISDIMMPVMNGHSFHEIIKETEFLNQIPFVFLTAKNDGNEMEKCLLNGADLFLTKPFKIETLIKIIQSKIERFEEIKNKNNSINPSESSYYLHEINTPLYGILGSINLLMNPRQNLKENEIDFFYHTIKTSGKRLDRTLKNSILYQNLKNNNLEFLENSNSEIATVFSKIKDEITDLDKTQAKRIYSNIEESNIKIQNKYLHFILFELLDNALKFSKKNKKIIVSGKKFNSEFYEIIIQDFGNGFSEEELKEINVYKQFNRDKEEQQGLGLGLFMSKTFIKKSKGVFSIISQKNVGTTIKIFFPLLEENQ
ncbi:response regulator [Flavobacterium sp.]|uniref:ATP-binding response regulator n=1 Tax=Flavobacterium sp. TaxID=239 RepID=UPI00378ADFA6